MPRLRRPHAPIRALVLDLDGTMVDSEPLSRHAWGIFLQQHGLVLDEAVYARMVGRRADESARLLQSHFGLALSVGEIIAGKNAVWSHIWQQGLPPMPGLDALIAGISARELPWAVATSSPGHYARQVLSRLRLRPWAIVGGDEVAHGKPAPDVYLTAITRLGVAAADCLAVEDSGPGCVAALNAGMTVAAIPNPLTPVASLPPVHYVCESLAGILPLLPNFSDGFILPE